MSMHTRISALLAKAEGASTDAEAAAYFAKADELMLRHAIDRAELAATDTGKKAEPIEKIYINYDSTAAAPKGFWNHLGKVGTWTVVRAMRGRVDMLLPAREHGFWIYGPKTELDYLGRVVPMIWRGAYAGLLRQRKSTDWSSWESSDKFSWDRGYLAGFCRGIADQIAERSEAVEQSNPGALVLVSREVEIKNIIRGEHTVRPTRRVTAPRSGYVQGRADGRSHALAGGELQ